VYYKLQIYSVDDVQSDRYRVSAIKLNLDVQQICWLPVLRKHYTFVTWKYLSNKQKIYGLYGLDGRHDNYVTFPHYSTYSMPTFMLCDDMTW